MINMYNKVILVGNLTRSIEIKHINSGLVIANTAIATSRKFKAQLFRHLLFYMSKYYSSCIDIKKRLILRKIDIY